MGYDMSEVAKVQVLLSCLHTVLMRSPLPMAGDEQYCSRCREYRFVGIVNGIEWAVICEECRYARRFGQDKYLADRAARIHYENKRHECIVTRKGVK